MSRQIYVGHSCPLSRFNVFNSVRVGDYVATSVEQARWFVTLKQMRRDRLADDLLQCRILRRNPAQCSTWVEARGGLPDAYWVINARFVYFDILVEQMAQPNSGFRQAFLSTLDGIGSEKPSFIVCSANHELVWSCGLRESVAKDKPNRPGFNEYGRILDKLYNGIVGRFTPRWGVEHLLNANSTVRDPFDDFPFRQAVLVLSDSICRNVKHVECGRIERVGGGVFSDLVRIGRSLRIGEFGMVVVHCGVNVARRASQIREAEFCVMEDFLRDLSLREPAPHILFSGALPLPGAKGVEQLNNMMEDRLRRLPIRFKNWSKHGGWPFVQNGQFVEDYLRMDGGDGFHLGPTGVRVLWREWCAVLPWLRYVSYRLSTKRYAIDVRPRKLDGGSRKRKRPAR